MQWEDYDEALWNRIKQEAKDKIKEASVSIFASDESPKAIGLAREAITAAEVDDIVKVRTIAFEDRVPDKPGGILVFNPPYGKRLEVEDIQELYGEIGDHLKKNYEGFDAWLISGNKEALKSIGLRTSRKMTLFNGSIECKFHKYELYRGSKKEKKKTTNPTPSE